MNSPAPSSPPDADLLEGAGLRERKKRETRLALHRAAVELVTKRGLGGVTTEDIARHVGVSPRTFFNYFAAKEAALAGLPATLTEELSVLVAERDPSEPLWTTTRAVVTRMLATFTEDEELWRRRRILMATRPDAAELLLGSQRAISTALVDAIGARGADLFPELDPWRTRMMALTAINALRVATELTDDASETRVLLERILDAHDPVYGAR